MGGRGSSRGEGGAFQRDKPWGSSGKLSGRPSGTFPISFPLFQVGNLGLLFMLLFFIFAALGVELFGDLGESGWGGQRSQGWRPRGSCTNSSLSLLPSSSRV